MPYDSAEKQRAWVEANRDHLRSYRRRWARTPSGRKRIFAQYGITPEQYDQMYADQGGVCAICRRPETARRGGIVKWLAIDHDHATGKVRGLLCQACNTVLGRVEDSVAVLRSAIEYLERS